MLLNHSLILQKPLEFIELKKGIYCNLAMIYKEKNDTKNALYFYFNLYKLNPDNVSCIVEIAILCRKTMMVEQSLYFFEMAFSKDNSPAMKLYYLEQIAILNFVLGHYHEALQKINILIAADFNVSALSELGQLIVDDLDDKVKEKHDFFSSSYQYYPQIKGNPDASKLLYISKILELREEYSKKRLEASKICASSSSALKAGDRMQEEFITITLRECRWKELLNSLLMILKIQKYKAGGTSSEEIRSKIKSSGSFNYLSNIDFDIFSSRFKFDILVPEKPPPVQTFIPISSPLKVEELIKEKPREERYGGGQMSLREKKNIPKPPEPVPTVPEVNPAKGLESILQRILKETLEPEEFRFFQTELNQLIGGYGSQYSTDSLQPEVKANDQLHLENKMREMSKNFVEQNISEESKEEKTHFTEYSEDDNLVVEEKEFNQFFRSVEGKLLLFQEAVYEVLNFLLSTKEREVNPSGLVLDHRKLFGPSPYLYLGE